MNGQGAASLAALFFPQLQADTDDLGTIKVTGAGSDRGLLSHRDWIFLEGFSTASGTQVDWTLDRQIRLHLWVGGGCAARWGCAGTCGTAEAGAMQLSGGSGWLCQEWGRKWFVGSETRPRPCDVALPEASALET